MLNLVHLESFIEVAKAKSITAASKRLYMNPSSLTQQMDLFEAELGFKVLVRSKKGCELTSAGETLLAEGQRILQDIDAVLGSCRSAVSEQDKTIKIALIAPYSAMAICSAFEKSHSGVRFEYQNFDTWEKDVVYSRLASHEVDVSEYGYVGDASKDGMSFFTYDEQRICCACKSNHPLAERESVTLRELEGHTISMCKNGSDVNKHVIERINAEGLDVRVNKVDYSPAKVIECCERGEFFLASTKQKGVFDSLSFLPLEPALHYRHSLVHLEDCRPVVREFIAFASSIVSGD